MAVREHGDAHLAPREDPATALRNLEAVILAPVEIALVPRGPEPSLPIVLRGEPRLERLAGRDGEDWAEVAVLPRSRHHVVVARGIGVPEDGHAAVGRDRDSRFPIVSGVRGDLPLIRPFPAIENAQVDIEV